MPAQLTTLENAERTAELSTKTTQGTGLFSNTTAYAAQVLRNQKINPTGPVEPPSVILSARGTFYLVKLSDTYGPGIYAIDELTREVLAPNTVGPSATQQWAERSPILLTSVEFNQVDITSQVPCLNNVKVFYSFGQNFGQVVIQGEVLLGPLGDLSYAGVERLVSFFWRNRVSVKRQPVAISVADNAYFVYLTGLRIGQVVADFHIMPFVMFGTLLDITREKASAVNRQGQVITGGSLNEPSLFTALRRLPEDDQTEVKLPDGAKPKTSVATDSPLNAGAEITPNNAGPASQEASEVQYLLLSGSQTQQEKDLAAMKRERQKTQEELDSLKRIAGANPDQKTQDQIASLEGNVKWWDATIPAQQNRANAARNKQAGANVAVEREVSTEELERVNTALAYIKEEQAATALPKPVSLTPLVSSDQDALSPTNNPSLNP